MFQRKRTNVAATVLAVLLTLHMTAVLAQAPSELSLGLADLNQQKYSSALTHFQAAVKTAPQSAQAHYCLAVSYQYLQQLAEAQREYGWVMKNTKDPGLLRRANKGFTSCAAAAESKPTAVHGGAFANGTPDFQGYAAGDTPITGSGDTSTMQPAASAQPAEPVGTPVAETIAGGSATIIDVYTDWCGYCKKFEPLFEKAKEQFAGKIEFRRLNAELPANAEFCKQYQITGYPTIMFFDGQEKLINRISGAPATYDDFLRYIKAAYPSSSQ